MMRPDPTFIVNVDLTNPGQFFACCGLLELADRRWPGAEGWFDVSRFMIALPEEFAGATEGDLIERISQCDISGSKEEEREELHALEAERRRRRSASEEPSPDQQARLSALGTEARSGAIRLGKPFSLLLDWWQSRDEATPKTWAGPQGPHEIARAAQDAVSTMTELITALDHGCVLRTPKEYFKGKAGRRKAVEPFYFDARRFAHALDVGFSLDVQNAETVAHPAVELLALVGIQRFRPSSGPAKWSFDYWTWFDPLAATVAAAVVSGAITIPNTQRYRFPLHSRDDGKRYKAFGFATPIGDEV